MGNRLQIKTLGGLSVEKNGEAVAGFASRKAEALLVYLACNPRPHPREVLAELLHEQDSHLSREAAETVVRDPCSVLLLFAWWLRQCS